MGARSRFKLQATFPTPLSRRNLMPIPSNARFGGVQIPVTRSIEKGTRMCPFSYGANHGRKKPLQVASDLPHSTLSAQLDADTEQREGVT